jgi:hypothetical protein
LTVKTPSLEQVQAVWQHILANPQAREALDTLKQGGFAIDHLTPNDLAHLNWSAYVALIPFLPDTPSRRRLYRGKALDKHRSLVRSLRVFAAQAGDPFCEIRRVKKNQWLHGVSPEFRNQLEKAADLIEDLISSNWSARHRNPRNTVIARLRWEIRHRTGAPHDSQLATLIEAAFTGAGQDPIFLEPRALERIEKRELEGRVKSACRLNFVAGKSPTPHPGISLSTRFHGKRKKRV